MRTLEENKQLYAEIILSYGLNIQKWQKLIIKSPIDAYDFVKILTEKAYEMWCKEVMYRWEHEELDCIRYNKAPEDSFDWYPQWIADWFTKEVREWAATLSLYMSDTSVFENVNLSNLKKHAKAATLAFKEYKDLITSSGTNWCVVSIPIKWWANTVYWNTDSEENMWKLWDQILSLVRLDKEDPIKEWETHLNQLKVRAQYMNDMNFKKLHYKSPKTDLCITLPDGHIWQSAEEVSKRGVHFHPNLPTEEVFSMPHKYWVNGTVFSTFPLEYQWKLIKNFSLTFKDWEVISYTAEEWEEILKWILETDETSKRLWEVALVPVNSPIYQSWLLYYNTLFDENASCHLALWTSYSTTLKWADDMNAEQRDKVWMNESSIHVDFMVWDETLCITWETQDWEMVEFFVDWKWNI